MSEFDENDAKGAEPEGVKDEVPAGGEPAMDAGNGGASASTDAHDVSVGGALSRRAGAALSKSGPIYTVGSLEAALLREFPACDAEDWDRTGLVVGEPALAVTRVAVALDPTVSAIREAADAGANVLVTHHPPFLHAPESFSPARSVAQNPGAGVWAAIQGKVALMCFHTALDVSPRAARVLPGMLGLSFEGRLVEPTNEAEGKGYGQVCAVAPNGDEPETLGRLAARCTATFARPPRVWGDFSSPVRTAVTATGSAGALGRACLAAGVDCLICGEIKYHEALDLSEAGLAVIEVGHDVSELPLVAVLADALARVGVAQDKIDVIDQSSHWKTPEAVRL